MSLKGHPWNSADPPVNEELFDHTPCDIENSSRCSLSLASLLPHTNSCLGCARCKNSNVFSHRRLLILRGLNRS